MPDTSSITIQQAFQTPFVKGVISQFPTPDFALQRAYGAMENRTFTPVRTFAWDQFNKTRTLATIKAPMTDATPIRKQKVGTAYGTLLRMAEKLQIYDEEIANLRPPGQPIGTLDQRGEQWAVRQINFMTQRHSNLMEYLLSKTLQGGFGLAGAAEQLYVTDLNASGNLFDVTMNIPASNKNQLALADDGSNIIDIPWSDASADIVTQLFSLRRAAIRLTGYEPSMCWCSSQVIGWLMNNISLQSIAGSANRVWNTVTGQPAQVDPSGRNLGGLSVRFNAIPWITFRVNDAVVSIGSSSNPQGADGTAVSEVTRVVPLNTVIFTPEPDNEWMTVYEGHEPVQEQVNSSPVFIRGFHSWSRRMLWAMPPCREAYMIDNFMPAIRIPNAVFNATVDF